MRDFFISVVHQTDMDMEQTADVFVVFKTKYKLLREDDILL